MSRKCCVKLFVNVDQENFEFDRDEAPTDKQLERQVARAALTLRSDMCVLEILDAEAELEREEKP